jgi:hypothetical protein
VVVVLVVSVAVMGLGIEVENAGVAVVVSQELMMGDVDLGGGGESAEGEVVEGRDSRPRQQDDGELGESRERRE